MSTINAKQSVALFPYGLRRIAGIELEFVRPLVTARLAPMTEQQWDEAKSQERLTLLAALRDQSIGVALSQSNALLWSRLVRALESNKENSKRARRRMLQAVQTATRYVTRSATKTSPFGRLGPVSLLSTEDHAADSVPADRVNRVRIDHAVFSHWIDLLADKWADVGVFVVRRNPTLTPVSETTAIYLSYDSFGESVRRINVPEAFLGFLRSMPVRGVEVTDLLSGHLATPVADRRAFVDKLLEKNILQLEHLPPVEAPRGATDSVLALAKQLIDKGVISRHLDRAVRMIEANISAFVACSPSHASRILERVERNLCRVERGIRAAVGTPPVYIHSHRAGSRRTFVHRKLKEMRADEGREDALECKKALLLPIARENLLREDVVNKPQPVANSEELSEIGRDAVDLVSRLAFMRAQSEEAWSGFAYCRERCAEKTVPIVELYSGYLKQRSAQTYSSRKVLSENIHFDLRDNGKLYLVLGQDHSDRQVDYLDSFGLVLQRIGQGYSEVILNHVVPGCGRYLSRFLPSFGARVLQRLRSTHQSLADPAASVGIEHGHCLNVDDYPMVPEEAIHTKSSHLFDRASGIVEVSNVFVSFNSKSNRFILSDGSGRELALSDFSYFAPSKQSGINELVLRLSGQMGLPFRQLVNQVRASSVRCESEGVTSMPRVYITNRLLLARASWSFQSSSVPTRRKSETAEQFHRRLDRHFVRTDLPRQFFLYGSASGIDGRSQVDTKPQFINLDSFSGKEVFLNAIRTISGTLLVEEALPNPSEMLRIGAGVEEEYWSFFSEGMQEVSSDE